MQGPPVEEILRDCADGTVRYLYLCHHDLTLGFDPQFVKTVLGKVDFIVFHGSFDQPTAALAHAQLPAAVYAEKEGTFTNVQGRVQRIHAAVPPLGESLPDLEILARLAAELGVSLPQATAREVFDQIGLTVPAFAGMTYEAVGETGEALR
jgi:predicted molibdopterin-dependent oxidoreductase YjgC